MAFGRCKHYLDYTPDAVAILAVLSKEKNPLLASEIAEKIGIVQLDNTIIMQLSRRYELITPTRYYLGRSTHTLWAINPKFATSVMEYLESTD